MARVWTHGVWTVRPGREDEFVGARHAMADAVRAELEPAGQPYLLRDRERPNVFRSFGPWDSAETVERFRALTQPRLAAIEPLLERFEAFTLDEVPQDD